MGVKLSYGLPVTLSSLRPVGHPSASTHDWQSGRGALQTRLPWVIKQTWKAYTSSGGHRSFQQVVGLINAGLFPDQAQPLTDPVNVGIHRHRRHAE